MSPVRYRNGMKLKVRCHRCNADVPATIYQRRIRWIAKLRCPHGVKHMGLTQPQEVLEDRGLLYHGDKERNKKERARMRHEMEMERKETDRTEELFGK